MSCMSKTSLVVVGIVLALAARALLKVEDPEHQRMYEGKESVGAEYDAWTNDGVLEHFWGEHIHHGYFGEDGTDILESKEAKVRLIQNLMEYGHLAKNDLGAMRVLDIGCGIGGSSRHIARTLGENWSTDGVSLSRRQVARAEQITTANGLSERCHFQVADALDLPFDNNTFDFVWTLESGEHMPDKKKFISEAYRVLKPGGRIVMATWCYRNAKDGELTDEERASLDTIYKEWALPFFVSIDEYGKIFDDLGMDFTLDDWSKAVEKTWPQAVWDGAYGLPWLLAQGPTIFYRTLRDVYAIWHMIRGFSDGYVRYGLAVATKL